jgi:Tfp pilus assembly protein PilX
MKKFFAPLLTMNTLTGLILGAVIMSAFMQHRIHKDNQDVIAALKIAEEATAALNSCLATNSPAVKNEVKRITIDEKDKFCKTDSDCTTVSTACSCSCGEGVNKNFFEKYSQMLESMCKDYSGKICKVLCPQTVKCIKTKCELQ